MWNNTSDRTSFALSLGFISSKKESATMQNMHWVKVREAQLIDQMEKTLVEKSKYCKGITLLQLNLS